VAEGRSSARARPRDRGRDACRLCAAAPALPDVAADVQRIEAIFTECRERFGQGGAFLFGAFGAADAMYAPVVSRLHTYGIAVGPVAEAYKQAIMALPAWSEWRAAALKETWIMANVEVDWPVVLRE
jgi:glutathione S-transferase